MAEINPLSFIGKSNDPSLTQRTVGASKALSDLQRGQALQTLSDRGAMARQKQSDAGSLQRKLFDLGLPQMSDPGHATAAQQRTGQMSDKRQADTSLVLADQLQRLAAGGYGPQKVTGLPLSQVGGPTSTLQRQTPTATAAATAGNVAIGGSNKKETKRKGFDFAPDGSLIQYETTESAELNTKLKGEGARAEAMDILRRAKKKLNDPDATIDVVNNKWVIRASDGSIHTPAGQ